MGAMRPAGAGRYGRNRTALLTGPCGSLLQQGAVQRRALRGSSTPVNGVELLTLFGPASSPKTATTPRHPDRKADLDGGGRRIRTFEGISQQIYSLPRLTASVSRQKDMLERKTDSGTVMKNRVLSIPQIGLFPRFLILCRTGVVVPGTRHAEGRDQVGGWAV